VIIHTYTEDGTSGVSALDDTNNVRVTCAFWCNASGLSDD